MGVIEVEPETTEVRIFLIDEERTDATTQHRWTQAYRVAKVSDDTFAFVGSELELQARSEISRRGKLGERTRFGSIPRIGMRRDTRPFAARGSAAQIELCELGSVELVRRLKVADPNAIGIAGHGFAARDARSTGCTSAKLPLGLNAARARAALGFAMHHGWDRRLSLERDSRGHARAGWAASGLWARRRGSRSSYEERDPRSDGDPQRERRKVRRSGIALFMASPP